MNIRHRIRQVDDILRWTWLTFAHFKDIPKLARDTVVHMEHVKEQLQEMYERREQPNVTGPTITRMGGDPADNLRLSLAQQCAEKLHEEIDRQIMEGEPVEVGSIRPFEGVRAPGGVGLNLSHVTDPSIPLTIGDHVLEMHLHRCSDPDVDVLLAEHRSDHRGSFLVLSAGCQYVHLDGNRLMGVLDELGFEL